MRDNSYEQQALKEAKRYVRSLTRNSSVIQRSTKHVQEKLNQRIPEKVHAVITESIKRMVEVALTTSEYIYPIEVDDAWPLQQREQVLKNRMKQYRHTAMLEGAGTGAGGFLLGMVDFPLLLSIKMKLLFDAGQLYGFDVKNYQERLYLLYIFMLTFSSDQKQKNVLELLINWEMNKDSLQELDWKSLQLEYRDTIDFVKMLQLIPGFGAVVGAMANKKLIGQLGESAMNMYRFRLLR
ncbi:EcsC family protein [Aquibacillus salsiterrae]|uniref:EcsC family protein n=1 Tax=Aquibacillus salsiterrae TaxID=2950439 RepID=A0A9X4AGG7_9BACI|nr:EcsC family protein [Aquibacillus salsiterrae]MDC3417265.1 EcsC family protein [Aquibacillus salsiterrae]